MQSDVYSVQWTVVCPALSICLWMLHWAYTVRYKPIFDVIIELYDSFYSWAKFWFYRVLFAVQNTRGVRAYYPLPDGHQTVRLISYMWEILVGRLRLTQVWSTATTPFINITAFFLTAPARSSKQSVWKCHGDTELHNKKKNNKEALQ